MVILGLSLKWHQLFSSTFLLKTNWMKVVIKNGNETDLFWVMRNTNPNVYSATRNDTLELIVKGMKTA